jgi:hypothetical protein
MNPNYNSSRDINKAFTCGYIYAIMGKQINPYTEDECLTHYWELGFEYFKYQMISWTT